MPPRAREAGVALVGRMAERVCPAKRQRPPPAEKEEAAPAPIPAGSPLHSFHDLLRAVFQVVRGDDVETRVADDLLATTTQDSIIDNIPKTNLQGVIHFATSKVHATWIKHSTRWFLVAAD